MDELSLKIRYMNMEILDYFNIYQAVHNFLNTWNKSG